MDTEATEAGSVDHSRSDRFLVAFAKAEEGLAKLLGTDSSNSFRWLVRQAARRDPVVRSVEDDLLELSDLRNAIVHDRGGGYVIAEPHPDALARLEKIVELIEDPPRIDEVMTRPVEKCGPDEEVAEVAKRMMDREISRIPVYDDAGAFIGLLTTHAIARWVATRLAGPTNSLHEEAVSAVLEFGDESRYEVVNRHRLVTEVLALFTDAHRTGRRLEAVLVTSSGDASEAPIGIVTVQDLPRLYELITP